MYQRDLQEVLQKYLHTKETVVVTGMRRVGKTTLLRQLFEYLHGNNKLFLDLENPLNRKYFEEQDYEKIVSTLRILGVNPVQQAYVFLDEVQFCKQIPSVVKYLSDHYQIKFFLTGSASFYLKNLFTESLTGRKRIFELYPLSFSEFISFKEEKLKSPKNHSMRLSQALYQRFQRLYEEYVTFGGFPEVVLKTSGKEKIEALQEIFSSYFNKEVLGLGDFRKNQVVRDLILLLMERIGNKIEIQKLARELGVSRITVQEYLAFLEGTYIFSLIKPFSQNRDVEIRSMPKVYCIDSGLARHIGSATRGSVFENAIFHQLRLKAKSIQYYQKKSGVEIDFIVDKGHAYEVKLRGDISDYKKLKVLQKKLRLKSAMLISYNFAPDTKVGYGFQL